MISKTRNRTSFEDIAYDLYLYFLDDLSFRNASSKALSSSRIKKRNHVAIWNWFQRYRPNRIRYKRRKVSEFIIDETQIKVGSELVWLWVIIEPESKEIIGMSLSKERNMFVAERFISSVIQIHGKHPVSTDGGIGTHRPVDF